MRNCGNCAYCDLLITEEPCMDCLCNSKWKPKEEDYEKKVLTVVYEQNNSDYVCNVLYVVDLNEKLPNGNSRVIKTLIGSYADDIFKELTEAPNEHS